MNIEFDSFQKTAATHGLSDTSIRAIWQELETKSSPSGAPPSPAFDFVHLLYYFGAMLVLGAFAWFMTTAWDALGGLGVATIALTYAVLFLVCGRAMWNRDLRTPGGLLIVLAVSMTPLFVYGLERSFGWWPEHDPGSYTNYHPFINGSWVVMEISTVVAGCLAVRRWRFPFIIAPIAHALWFMSMDIADLVFHGSWSGWEQRLAITAVFGAMMLVLGYIVDIRSKGADFAFWIYFFGLLALFGSLSSMDNHSEFSALLYGLLHLFFIAVAILLKRRTFMVFGALGVFGYLGHLAHHLFKDSLLFPFALCGLGLIVMAVGIWFQKNRPQVESGLRSAIPAWVKDLLPERVR